MNPDAYTPEEQEELRERARQENAAFEQKLADEAAELEAEMQATPVGTHSYLACLKHGEHVENNKCCGKPGEVTCREGFELYLPEDKCKWTYYNGPVDLCPYSWCHTDWLADARAYQCLKL